jgi:hypothetical protein
MVGGWGHKEEDRRQKTEDRRQKANVNRNDEVRGVR